MQNQQQYVNVVFPYNFVLVLGAKQSDIPMAVQIACKNLGLNVKLQDDKSLLNDIQKNHEHVQKCLCLLIPNATVMKNFYPTVKNLAPQLSIVPPMPDTQIVQLIQQQFATKTTCIFFYNNYDPFYEFTNFFNAPITVDGHKFPTSEHYFQAMKFFPHRKDLVQQIQNTTRPKDVFKLAHDNYKFERTDWKDERQNVMRKALWAKFAHNPQLNNLLLSTGNAMLVEHTTNDKYWGDNGDGSGRNRLGFLLMECRDKLKNK